MNLYLYFAIENNTFLLRFLKETRQNLNKILATLRECAIDATAETHCKQRLDQQIRWRIALSYAESLLQNAQSDLKTATFAFENILEGLSGLCKFSQIDHSISTEEAMAEMKNSCDQSFATLNDVKCIYNDIIAVFNFVLHMNTKAFEATYYKPLS
jgi:hypothetical protein